MADSCFRVLPIPNPSDQHQTSLDTTSWLGSPPPFCFLLSLTGGIQVFASGSASWPWNLTNIHSCFFIFLLLCLCVHWLEGGCEDPQTCSTCSVGSSPPCWSFGSEILLWEREGVSHLCNPNFSFYHSSNREAVTAWNCLYCHGLRVTYYFICIFIYRAQGESMKFLTIWYLIWLMNGQGPLEIQWKIK